MSPLLAPQQLDPRRTTWHITFGTYGTRLHGSGRATVDKLHNQLNEPFLSRNSDREDSDRGRMRFPQQYLSLTQRTFVEVEIPSICDRGGWSYRVCAAAPDHIHVLCDVVPDVHGEKVRRLLKRWLGQELSKQWPLPSGGTWWAEEGSNIAVRDEKYLNNCFKYIFDQRATKPASQSVPAPDMRPKLGAEDGPAR
jgi:REP element-mobilizing transposase RayT